ncbi:MAG: energy-coupling factor ABC transporter ATP-binding protein [Limnochordales bacterium]
MGKAVIETIDLVHTYKTGVTALKGVNLKIYENQVVSIVGQNGSGKTTLVRHFNGLLKPTSGKVLVDGEDTAGKRMPELARKVGYVFQNPNHQIFCTTVREELLVAPRNFNFSEDEQKRALDEVVELMGLASELDKHPLTLDYTSKKIVTIASVLIYKPNVLVLDEPTNGLDQSGREMLTKIIDMMKAAGHTVVMISHDMDYVAEVSERVVVMANGQVIKDGAPAEVFLDREALVEAQIEPPQITELDLYLSNGAGGGLALTVADFVRKYQ